MNPILLIIYHFLLQFGSAPAQMAAAGARRIMVAFPNRCRYNVENTPDLTSFTKE